MKRLVLVVFVLLTASGIGIGLYSIPSVRAELKEFFGGDPDLGPFDIGMSKEEFMLRRAEQIAMLRGVEKDKPFDPQLRINAIKEMEELESKRLKMPASPEKDATLATWTEIGPNPIPNGQTTSVSTAVSGRVTAIAVNSTNPSIAFVGTAQGGLYRTTDGGATWTPLMDSAASLAIGAVTIDPTDPNIVFVGTGEGNLSADSFFGVGLYRINNALSATPILNGPFQIRTNGGGGNAFINTSITKIVVDPTNNNNVFVSNTLGFGGISGSQNPGPNGFVGLNFCANAQAVTPTFIRVTTLPGGGAAGVSDIVMEPGNPNTVLVGQQDFGGGGLLNSGIWRSTNALSGAGATSTWTRTLDFTGTQTAIKLANNSIAGTVTVLAATGDTSGALRRSIDGGATWSAPLAAATGFCGGQCFYDIAVGIDPADSTRIYLAGSANGASSRVLVRSTNSGVSFQQIDTGLHADSHAFVLAPSNSAIAYTGNDGGVWRSDNVNTATPASVAWIDGNTATFRATQFISIAIHPTDPNFTIGGTQDNGTNFYRPNATWTRADFGDGGYTLIDQNAADTTNVRMYHTYFNNATLQGYGTVATTASAVDGGWAFRGCQAAGATTNGITCNGSVLFYAPIEQGPGSPNTVYYGSDRLYRSADAGVTHAVVSQNPITAGVPISAVGISPQDDNVRIVGQTNGGIFGTTTGANPLVNLDPANAVPNNYIARAVVSPTNANTAYVSLSAFGVVNVWRTANLNGAPPTWTASNGTGANILPLVPVNALVIDPLNAQRIYAGTDIGVFTSPDGGGNWFPFGTGLPRVAVFDMAITNGSPRSIRIATHGRGMWQIPPLAPSAAPVRISGRVVTQTGSAVRRALVTLTDPDGVSRQAVTNTFGYFRFEGVKAGQDYFVSVAAKGLSFDSRIISVADQIDDIVFTASGGRFVQLKRFGP